jgi:acetate---CoA ligase (ADP-forming)
MIVPPRTLSESAARCHRVLFPGSIAIVGASPRENTLHGRAVRNLISSNFPGPLYPINPRYESVLGLRAFPTVASVGADVDLALLLVSADRCIAALDDCINAGVKAAIVFSSGFGEAGPRGTTLHDALVTRRDEIVIAGPNCNAVLSQPARAGMGFGPALEFAIPNADRAFLSHSGAVATAVVTRAIDKGIGFRYVIATGNEVDLGVEDYLAFLSQEESTVRSCLLFLETIRDVPRFCDAAVKCGQRGIRLIALKVGRSQRAHEISAAHTGALAGPIELYRALFDKLGIWSVETLEQLYLCAQFDNWDERTHGGIAMITISGGNAALAIDDAESHGLRLPALEPSTKEALRTITGSEAVATNPFDCSGQVVNETGRWNEALSVLASQPDVYAVVAILGITVGGTDGILTQGIEALAARGQNMALVWPSSSLPTSSIAKVSLGRVPVFDRIEDAVACLAARQRGLDRSDPEHVTQERYLAGLRMVPNNDTSSLESVLERAGVRIPREVSCGTVAEVAEAVRFTGTPVVLKATRVLHKSEAGAVVSGLRDAAAIVDRAVLMSKRHGFPLIVQQQVPGARELFVGCTRTDFGVAAVLGAGGVLAELLRDTVTILAPVQPHEVRLGLGQLRLARLLAGYRHLAPVEPDRMAVLLGLLAEFVMNQPTVASIDLNPVIVSDDGQDLWAVDRKVVLRPAGRYQSA